MFDIIVQRTEYTIGQELSDGRKEQEDDGILVKKLVKSNGVHHKFFVHGLGTIIVILGAMLAIILYSNQWHQQQYFLDKVQGPLVELQGIIEHQERNEWSEPQLVSNQLHVLVDFLEYGLQNHTFPSKTLSRSEYEHLQVLASFMRSLPNHEIYSSATWDESSIQRAEQLNAALKASNLKMRTTINVDWDAFNEKINVLIKALEIG